MKLADKEIVLPVMGCVINLVDHDGENGWTGSSISTSWHSDKLLGEDVEYDAAIDGIEALVMAHAQAGVDVESPAYLEGLETAIMGAANNT